MLLRTAKSCGPDAPTLASSSRRLSRPYRARTKPYPLTTVAKEPGHRGARSKPLKPLRAGMPGDSGVLVVTRVRFTNAKCTRGRGCSGHPAFPTPSKGREINANLGRIAPRGREGMFGILADTVIPGRCQRVRAKRGPMTGSASNPESRDSGPGPADHPGMTEPELVRGA